MPLVSMDQTASNYDPQATQDDGSCVVRLLPPPPPPTPTPTATPWRRPSAPPPPPFRKDLLSNLAAMAQKGQLPRLNQAIASFCKDLVQHSVIVSIGPYKTDFCNPNGEEKMREFGNYLAGWMDTKQNFHAPLFPDELLAEFYRLHPDMKRNH